MPLTKTYRASPKGISCSYSNATTIVSELRSTCLIYGRDMRELTQLPTRTRGLDPRLLTEPCTPISFGPTAMVIGREGSPPGEASDWHHAGGRRGGDPDRELRGHGPVEGRKRQSFFCLPDIRHVDQRIAQSKDTLGMPNV